MVYRRFKIAFFKYTNDFQKREKIEFPVVPQRIDVGCTDRSFRETDL